MTEFKRVNVQGLVSSYVTKLLPSTPHKLDNAQEIIRLLNEKAFDLDLDEFHQDLVDVFQLAELDQKKKFSRGFPGVVLTAVVGRLVDLSYQPYTQFYDISPRSLFEKHISPVLRDKYGAPMGKSDPLNVAKGSNILDDTWASGNRKPSYAAKAASRLTHFVNRATREQLELFLELLVYTYLLLAVLFNREYKEIKAGLNPFYLYGILKVLVEEAPGGGQTVQAIVGAVLEAQHQVFEAHGILSGIGESVFATNTTSKKPGDFVEKYKSQTHIYEVTAKVIDLQRVTESAEAIFAYLEQLEEKPDFLEVTFLCRSEDIQLPGIESNSYIHQGIHYYFVDIWNWLDVMLERIGAYGRKLLIDHVNRYVSQNSTQLKVKTTWEKLLSEV